MNNGHQVPQHCDKYAINLGDALENIMSKDAFTKACQKPTTLQSRAPTTGLPRTIADRAGLTLTQTDFERIMGTNDLVGVEYLEQGMRAAAAVARMLILDPETGKRGYATGFMVAPRLLLTNRHVLPHKEVAAASMAEFGYEYDVYGMTKNTEVFRLAPDEVFIVGDATAPLGKDADFALVAVAPYAERSRVPLATVGYLRLDDQPGKVAEHEFITIIQHPGGKHKQVALRENEVIAKGSNDSRPVLLYRSDTAPGSSGSPCFNDQWQVVALHSRGVPKTEDGNPKHYITRSNRAIHEDSLSQLGPEQSALVYEANLGVRISFIVDTIRKSQINNPQKNQKLVTDFLADVQHGGPPVVQIDSRQLGAAAAAFSGPPFKTPALDLRFADSATVVEAAAVTTLAEGYDPYFLDPELPVPLPEVGPDAERFGRVLELPRTGGYELKYPHYSVIMNEDRRLAFVSACNIDGARKKGVERSNKFYVDRRISPKQQTDDYLYYEPGGPEDEFFDRGHLTRRDDVAWGTAREAKAASDASFAFPNISPQHRAFNQSLLNGVWGELENYVLDNTVAERIRASVFNGPIFSLTDLVYKGVPIPKEFYKVVVVVDPEGGLRASAYIASQADLVADNLLTIVATKQGLKRPRPVGEVTKNKKKPQRDEDNEELPVGEPFVGEGRRRKYVVVEQVTIRELEKKTGLLFNEAVHSGSVVPETDEEALVEGQEFPRKRLISLNDVVL